MGKNMFMVYSDYYKIFGTVHTFLPKTVDLIKRYLLSV